MSQGPRTPRASDYHVGWICAIQTEYVVAQELLDHEYDPPELSPHDENVYNFGRIGCHNVVVACLPKGVYGVPSAAAVAVNMLRSFTELDIRLMVGVGGGAPSFRHDVRLGDVVVSVPTAHASGLIHYNFGKSVQDKRLVQTAYIDGPPQKLLAAIQNLATTHERKGHKIRETIDAMIGKNRRLRKKYTDPGPANDTLFKSDFEHPLSAGGSCDACALVPDVIVPRIERDIEDDRPVVHYGLIASANQLMKDACTRDHLAKEERVLCFEMEAAGLSRNFPCLVIRGICDYSDSHKNDVWQGYAAATAAAYAKELLQFVSPAADNSNVSDYQSLYTPHDSYIVSPKTLTQTLIKEPWSEVKAIQSIYKNNLDYEMETDASTDVSFVTPPTNDHVGKIHQWEEDTETTFNEPPFKDRNECEYTNYQRGHGTNSDAANTPGQADTAKLPEHNVVSVPLVGSDINKTREQGESWRARQGHENRTSLHDLLNTQQSSANFEAQKVSDNTKVAFKENDIALRKAQTENASKLRSSLSEIPSEQQEKMRKASRLLHRALEQNSASKDLKRSKVSQNTMNLVQHVLSDAHAQTRSNRQQLPKLLADRPTIDKKEKQKNSTNIRDLFSKKPPSSPPPAANSKNEDNRSQRLPAIMVESPASTATYVSSQQHPQGRQPTGLHNTIIIRVGPPLQTNDMVQTIETLVERVTNIKCRSIVPYPDAPSAVMAYMHSQLDAQKAFDSFNGQSVVLGGQKRRLWVSFATT